MTGLSVARTRGGWVFGDARLSTGWAWRRGQIHRDGRVWAVSPTDPGRTGVTLRTGAGGEAIRLHPSDSHVPGPGGQAVWRPGRRTGRLTRDGHHLTLRLPPFGGAAGLDFTGSWPELELVVLTAVFALMTRRRLLTLRIIAVAGATGHG